MDTLAVGKPRTFVGGKVFVGFNETEGPLEYVEIYKAYKGYCNQIILAAESCLGIQQDVKKNQACEEESLTLWLFPAFALLFLILFAALCRNWFCRYVLIKLLHYFVFLSR